MQAEWSEAIWILWVQCIILWWPGWSTASLSPRLLHWHWVGLAYQPNWWPLIAWTWHLMPHWISVLMLKIAFNRTGWPITTASVRPDLPSQSMSSTTGTWQACGGGGVVPLSLVEITCISKQYQVSGQSGLCFLTRDLDGEWDEVLPNASVSSRPFKPLGGVRVGPSVWVTTPEFWSSRLLDLVAINMEILAVGQNSR